MLPEEREETVTVDTTAVNSRSKRSQRVTGQLSNRNARKTKEDPLPTFLWTTVFSGLFIMKILYSGFSSDHINLSPFIMKTPP